MRKRRKEMMRAPEMKTMMEKRPRMEILKKRRRILLVLFQGLPLLLVNRIIASLDSLVAGKPKEKYHSDRLTLQQSQPDSNFPMVNFQKERFSSIRMKIGIALQQLNCVRRSA